MTGRRSRSCSPTISHTTHSTALLETKEQFIKSVTSGNIDYVSIVPSESDWKVSINGGTALVNGVAEVNVVDKGNDRRIRIRFTTVHANRAGSVAAAGLAVNPVIP